VTHQKLKKNHQKFPKTFYVVINSTFFLRLFLKSRITFKPTRKKREKDDQSHKKMSRQDKICWMDLEGALKENRRRESENKQLFMRMKFTGLPLVDQNQ
jgi:hypothetical protein